MRILDLYAGIGGNRKLWEGHEVTAIEYNATVAQIYKKFFPLDHLYILNAHQFLLNFSNEYDFIWSSPPCSSHSQLKKMGIVKGSTAPEYPDLKLYEEIIFLTEFYKGLWVVENVKPYYEPLIKPTKIIGRHYFWSNFPITDFKEEKTKRIVKTRIKEGRYGFDLTPFKVTNQGKLKRTMLRNLIDPKLGLHILNCAINKLKS